MSYRYIFLWPYIHLIYFPDSNGVVVKLNASKAGADMELEQTKKKLAAMEKLNRTLTAERSQLLKGKKEATENGS